jgi:hypothetical protein
MRALTSILFCLAASSALAATHGGHKHVDHAAQPEIAKWTSFPLIVPSASERDRRGILLAPRNLNAASLEALSPVPGSAPTTFPVDDGRAFIRPDAPDAGNYYWVRARALDKDRLAVASTVTFFANPGPSPKDLLKREKSELEILPQPLPREHGNYREAETARFLVRFGGAPLANAPVTFQTENGGRAMYVSDAAGVINVTFPTDIEAKGSGHGGHHGGGPRGNFVLAVEHSDGGRRYLTAFNYVYTQRADAGKSYVAGIGFGMLGMLLAVPLLRRKHDKKGAA